MVKKAKKEVGVTSSYVLPSKPTKKATKSNPIKKAIAKTSTKKVTVKTPTKRSHKKITITKLSRMDSFKQAKKDLDRKIKEAIAVFQVMIKGSGLMTDIEIVMDLNKKTKKKDVTSIKVTLKI